MKKPRRIVVVGAGINGLVAANYLQKAGCQVTVLEQSSRIGGACVAATAEFEGQKHQYALGASVLGLMQRFVYEQTGLAERLQTYVPNSPKQVFFPGQIEPTRIFRDPTELTREFNRAWGERGQVQQFREDEARVVEFLQTGYRNAEVPDLAMAHSVLGGELTDLWIRGTARTLLNHYFSSERTKVYMAMTVTESGPVSLDAPYSAFTLPLMDSGSIFDGYYGFVAGGIWRITQELASINSELGVVQKTNAQVIAVDTENRTLTYAGARRENQCAFDYLVFATDPLTALRLTDPATAAQRQRDQQFRGSSGKLNLLFRKPVRWKHSPAEEDAAFRFVFAVDNLEQFEAATLRVDDPDMPYAPGYMQIYCEGAAMRRLRQKEGVDRLAVFFKNLALGETGKCLREIESEIRSVVFRLIENPQDCAWSRLLTPRDLQQLFHFPEGNIDHTVLTGGQTFAERTYSGTPDKNFYQLGDSSRIMICGAGTYPCGSVTGTAGYMCSRQLLRQLSDGAGPQIRKH